MPSFFFRKKKLNWLSVTTQKISMGRNYGSRIKINNNDNNKNPDQALTCNCRSDTIYLIWILSPLCMSMPWHLTTPWGCLDIKTPSCRYRNSQYKDKTVWRPSHLHNGNPIPGKTVFILTGGELRNGVDWFLTGYATDSVRFSQRILDKEHAGPTNEFIRWQI